MVNFTSLKQGMLLAMLFVAGSTVAQTELLQNGGFEEWNDNGTPTHWVTASTAGNATLSQSTDARSGDYSVLVAGASSNRRLAYEETTLRAGTYTFTVYAKSAEDSVASCRLGYAVLNADGSLSGSNYVYTDYVNGITNSEWVQASYEFTLTDEETQLCLLVMNPSSAGGVDLLVDDASLTTTDGGIVEDSGSSDDTYTAIFSETFSASLGDFTIDNVIPAEGLDGEVWTYDTTYVCAKATSYTNGENIPTESWLISPEIDLTAVSAATLSFDHACNYFNDVQTDVTLWVREGSDSVWVQLEVPTYPTSFTFVGSGDISLADYVGKTIQLGFKYVCTEKAGTYEVRNFLIEERETETAEDTGNDSSQENPYTVAQAIEKYDANNPQADTWVTGYIVGYVSGISLSESSAVFGVEAVEDSTVSNTNLLIADDVDETDYTNCLVIQLPSGSVREALNLRSHPENLGASVILKGSLERYFGTYGLRSVSEYVLSGVASEPVNEVTFAKTTEIVSGKRYIIVALADGVSKVAQTVPLNPPYGYLYVTDATADNDEITIDEDYAYTITESAIGYTIQDSYGRYLYMTGTYNSFNVSETLPDSGYLWTISFDEDGLATITNQDMGKWIQYSTGYTSFGSYATTQSGGILPYLYMEKESTGVAAVSAANTDAPVEVYTLDGLKVGNSLDGLKKGIYIVKQGDKARKVLK